MKFLVVNVAAVAITNLKTILACQKKSGRKLQQKFITNLGWKNLGEILGSGKIKDAEKLGASIK